MHSKQSCKWAYFPLGRAKVFARRWFKTAKWAQLPLVQTVLNEKLSTTQLPGKASAGISKLDCFMHITTFHAVFDCRVAYLLRDVKGISIIAEYNKLKNFGRDGR